MVKPIPDGFSSVTVSLIVKDAASAIEFYKKAFLAEEMYRFLGPDGKSIMHAEVKIGNSIIMISDEMPQMNCLSPLTIGGAGAAIYLYVEDADETFKRAISSGAKPVMPIMDAFWGDRWGSIIDPFGHTWSIATHKTDMTMDEIKKAGEALFKQMAEKR